MDEVTKNLVKIDVYWVSRIRDVSKEHWAERLREIRANTGEWYQGNRGQTEFQKGKNNRHWLRSQGVVKGKCRPVPLPWLTQIIEGLSNSSFRSVVKVRVKHGH